jgi:hypothetical protein
VQQQPNTVPRLECCCQSICDKLKLAAERIDPSEYPEIALALVALDVPIGQVKRLAHAIAAVRDEEYHRHFIGEYADLVWETVRNQVPMERRNLHEQQTKVKVPESASNPKLV